MKLSEAEENDLVETAVDPVAWGISTLGGHPDLTGPLPTDPAARRRVERKRELADQYLVERVYTPDQARVMESLMHSRRVAVHSGHSTGKSFSCADLVLWFKTTFAGSKVITTAPTARQVEDVLWGEIKARYYGAKVPLGGEMLPKAPRWGFSKNEFALGFASSDYNQHTMSGFHAEYLLVVIDEAAGVSPLVWDACTRLATGRHNYIVAIGNPGDAQGPFYEACTDPDSPWYSIHLDSTNHPNVVCGEEIVPGAATREWVEEKEAEYGGTEDWRYQAFVRGYFPQGGERTLIRPVWVDDAWKREQSKRGPVTLGVDVADFGPDEAVVQVLRGPSQIAMYRKSGQVDPMELVALVATVAKKHGADEIIVDSDGDGIGIWSRLCELGFNAVDFRGGRKPPEFQPGKKFNKRWETYQNWRTMAWFELARGLREGKVSLLADKVTKKQLCALEYKFQASGLQQLERKEDLKKRLGDDFGSPDRADALAMAWWGYVTRGAARKTHRDEKRRRKGKRWQDEYDELVAG